MQRPALTAARLEAHAAALSRLPGAGRHRTWWLGNFSVEVLELALGELGMELRWHDARDAEFATLQLAGGGAAAAAAAAVAPAAAEVALSNSKGGEGAALPIGLILNVQGSGLWAAMTGSRHWITLLRCGSKWWNCDSYLAAPQPVGGSPEVRAWLKEQTAAQGAHVFSVWPAAAVGGKVSSNYA